jgi:hypothetical protein
MREVVQASRSDGAAERVIEVNVSKAANANWRMVNVLGPRVCDPQ